MNILERPSTNGIATHLENVVVPPSRKPRRVWYAVLAVIIIVALVATTIAIVRVRSNAAVSYTTVPVLRQDLVQSVTATGTANPQNTIAVGTQVSGIISEIDVDYNSHVRKGQVLARIDPTNLQAALDQAKAQLAQSQAQAQAAAASAQGAQSGIGNASANERAAAANADAAEATARANRAAVGTATANVTKAQSALQLAQQTVNRDQSLLGQGYISQSQLDTDRSNLVSAQSAVTSAQAAVQQAAMQASASFSQAQAGAAQTAAQTYAASTAQSQAANQAGTAAASQAAVLGSEAQVRSAELDLQRSVITSPVDGTVVARSVSVGQTVASSFQTPTLFSIAQDLNKMEVDLSVGEPDIGNVKSGDGVDFTVLAYPSRTFHGVVSQVRINPVTTQNVVTYTTVVLVDNRDGVLLPGMTANAAIHVARTNNALVVPVTALAYRPAFNGQRRRRGSGAAGSGAAQGSNANPGTQNGANGNAGAQNGAAGKTGNGNAAGQNANANGGGQNANAQTGNNAGANAGSPWGATLGGSSAVAAAGSSGHIFVERNGKLTRIPVDVILVNGTQAAVEPSNDDDTLNAGDNVVVADSSASSGSGRGNSQNPMAGGGTRNVMRGLH